ncbi:MAG TPA: trans-aconitate 2-methyltransferase [Jatrophihabitantaceae bacterium]|nr:trans-aconitate 2-methyltransferase [Jatrophihabitantaceae bacterium]
MDWDPSKYLQFADQRSRPFVDLTSQIAAAEPRRVVDAGCGSGELTELLSRRWPSAQVFGFDSSPDMIERARRLATDRLAFAEGDVRDWRPDPDVDVLVSNAVLQWVPDHLDLIRRWADELPSRAWFGWQVPGNFRSPSHVLMRELAESSRWAAKLDGVLRHHDAVAEPADYAAVLLERGWEALAWETTYLHMLSGSDPVLEWVRGTGLRPILAALDVDDAREFTGTYARQVRAAYPAGPFGTPFPFRRLFCVGRKL